MTTTSNLELPTGYDARPPREEDAGAVAEVITASRAAYGDDEVATAEDVQPLDVDAEAGGKVSVGVELGGHDASGLTRMESA